MPFDDLKLCFVAFMLFLVVMQFVLSMISDLFILLSWGACFIPSLWHHIFVMTFILSLASNLFILLSWGAIFISDPWHRIAAVTLFLSLVSILFILLSWDACVYFWPLTPCCCNDAYFSLWPPTYLLFCQEVLVLSLVTDTVLLWWCLFYPWPLAYLSFVMWQLFYP